MVLREREPAEAGSRIPYRQQSPGREGVASLSDCGQYELACNIPKLVAHPDEDYAWPEITRRKAQLREIQILGQHHEIVFPGPSENVAIRSIPRSKFASVSRFPAMGNQKRTQSGLRFISTSSFTCRQ